MDTYAFKFLVTLYLLQVFLPISNMRKISKNIISFLSIKECFLRFILVNMKGKNLILRFDPSSLYFTINKFRKGLRKRCLFIVLLFVYI